MRERIFAVLVLYKCQLTESKSYQSLLKEAPDVRFLVYDNSPEGFVQDMSQMPQRARYVRDTANSGLSEAYNQGAEMARQLGCSHLLLLDQDTRFPTGALDAYASNLSFNGIVAPLMQTVSGMPFSPCDISGAFPKGTAVAAGDYSLRRLQAVNSGICIPVDLFRKAGGYDPAVYLDFSDFQFQRRVRAINGHIRILGIKALQDFSDDCRDARRLLPRFRIYLDCAAHFTTEGLSDRVCHSLAVLKHTLKLAFRTHRPAFILSYIRHYIL